MDNLDLMRKRLNYQGGDQEHRMIQDKYKTFTKALSYSYQGCDVHKVQNFNDCEQLKSQPSYRALINPDKTKQNYDDKILSIDYSYCYLPGDIFLWENTNTHWIIYLSALTEDAYFRGEIRRCKYQIKFKDEDGNVCTTWAAIQGPMETAIDSIQKNQVRIDRPNWSLNILIPKNKQTLYAFNRYSEFLFEGKCWRVEVVDSISTENVLEVNADEYYIDRDTDDVLNLLKDGLVIDRPTPAGDQEIHGEQLIQMKLPETYSVDISGGRWCIKGMDDDSSFNIKNLSTCASADGKEFTVKWIGQKPGRFRIVWHSADGAISYFKDVVVDSLF